MKRQSHWVSTCMRGVMRWLHEEVVPLGEYMYEGRDEIWLHEEVVPLGEYMYEGGGEMAA